MNNVSWLQFLLTRKDELILRAGEHLMLSTTSTLIAIMLGLTIGILAFKYKTWQTMILSLVGLLQTIPSLALLVLLMTVLGKIGVAPALIALTLYALLPIVRSTLAGLNNCPRELVLAAQGLGMTPWQEIYLVRLPLAAPVILAGIRTAAVVSIGIATLAAFVGAGGLGEFINRGLALSNSRLILLGAIPAGLLALLSDFVFAAAQWGLKPVLKPANRLRLFAQKFALSLPIFLFTGSLVLYVSTHFSINHEERIRVGSKHFSEQLILGELIAQIIETKTHLKVERRFNLGGTMVCHGALLNNEIDIYPEYTGTSLTTILSESEPHDKGKIFDFVNEFYHKKFQATWLSPFGFNNSWAILVSPNNPKLQNVFTISDLEPMAPRLTIGLTAEFAERVDGYPGLIKIYNLHFGQMKDLDPNLAYSALAKANIDIAVGNSTDGRIFAYGLRCLKDNRSFFPPYEAAPVARLDVLKRHPELVPVLNSLSNKINDATIQFLNYQVDGLKLNPSTVVHNFLKTLPPAH